MTAIAPFSQPGRFWRGNLHTHSTLSDGRMEPMDVCAAYRSAGYDFLTLSEHFVHFYDWPIADTRPARSNNFTTILGAELHAPKTEVGELWHILATGLPLDFAPCTEDEDGEQLARRAMAAGAFVSIAHPSWSQLTIGDGRSLDFAHAVEVYNHGCAVENDRGDGWYLMDQLLNDGRRLTAVATDDAHFNDHDYDAFGGWVHVKADSLDPDALLQALKDGHFYSSQGPQLHNVDVDGDEIHIECSPVEAITILGGTSRTVRQTGRSITRATLDLKKLTRKASDGWLAADPSPWLRVAIVDAAGRRAWTNPIWLDSL